MRIVPPQDLRSRIPNSNILPRSDKIVPKPLRHALQERFVVLHIEHIEKRGLVPGAHCHDHHVAGDGALAAELPGIVHLVIERLVTGQCDQLGVVAEE